MRRLLLHEARVHAIPGRDLRDFGDAILLHDPVEREPFWNRLEGLRWPEDPAAFDRRLTETLVLFASIGRTPAHLGDTDPRFPRGPGRAARVERVPRHGDGQRDDAGRPGTGPALSHAAVSGRHHHRALVGVEGPDAEAAASAIVEVLIDAFEVDPERRRAIEGETVASLGHPWFTHYLIRADGEPAAVGRRATFEGVTYLSSIGTAGWARGRGLGTIVTRMAASEALADGSSFVYLGVFADNSDAIGVYQRSGFQQVGSSCPDMLLW